MHTLGLRRIGITAVAVLVAAIGVSAPARADDTTGSMSGQFVDADGAPVVGSYVQVVNADTWDQVGYVVTDESGDYSVSDIPPGNYLVNFEYLGMTMYSGNTADFGQAAAEPVVAGANTVVNEQALPVGTLTGTLTDANGNAVEGAGVYVSSSQFGGRGASTDGTGAWSVVVFSAPDYRVSFSLPSGLTEFAPSAGGRQDAASLYPVGPDQTVTVNDRVPASGVLGGTFRDANGRPLSGVYVYVTYPDGSDAGFAGTDGSGYYEVPVFAGTYIVRFQTRDGRVQYAYGAQTVDTATPIAVAADDYTTVNDALPQNGTITVTAVNGKNGNPILGFCAYTEQQSACTTTGSAVLANLPAGPVRVSISATSPKYIYAPDVIVDVIGGQNVDLVRTLVPGETVKTTIVDSVTGLPIAGACVHAFEIDRAGGPHGAAGCSNKNGVISITPLAPDLSYALFVDGPQGGSYGAQWVGNDGHGTGMEQNALALTARSGRTVTIANIQMDQGGSISGTVTNAAGTPIQGAGVGPNTFTPGSGAGGDIVGTDANGNYTLTNLGPYAWPIFTNGPNVASIWSGGVGNRYNATPVQVTSGATATYNVTMTAGVALQGTALQADGSSIPDGAFLIVYNAKTGDPMGSTFANADGSFSVRIASKQNIRIAYWYQVGSAGYSGYYGGGTGTVVHIPGAGMTIDIVLVHGNIT